MFEQTFWILFLKYLDDLERDKATAALRSGKTANREIGDPGVKTGKAIV